MLVSTAGFALSGVAGVLGGHLAYRRGVGVTTVVFESGPSECAPVETVATSWFELSRRRL